jgi:protein-disulfide isomerase
LESIHPLAFQAAAAAKCAGKQHKYWEMHEALFARQPGFGRGDLLACASGIGVDRPDFDSCLDGEVATDIRADQHEGARLGVLSTPTFFIGRILKDRQTVRILQKITGNVPSGVFRLAIDKAVLGRDLAKDKSIVPSRGRQGAV